MDKMDYNKKRVEHWFYMLAYGTCGFFIIAIMAKAGWDFLMSK